MARLMHLYLAPITVVMALSVPLFVDSVTLGLDIEALQNLKWAIDPFSIPESSFLSTWNFEVDPCESSGGYFLGILCAVPLNLTSRVTTLVLDEGGYDGYLPSAIGNLTELTILKLGKNKFRGLIPTNISNLQKLTTLSLSGNFFTGNLPPGLGRLTRLEVLDLSHNELSGSFPQVISELRTLSVLRVCDNQFIGRIPNLNALWQLDTLDLSRNNLYGYLPQLPTNIKTLLLSHNTLSGHISAIRRLKNLKALDLSDNKLSGSITPEILTLPNLNQLNISTNSFSVIEVTENPGEETLLQLLDVQGNRLRGRLPVNLVTYGNLTAVNLANNQFYGRIPGEYGLKLGGEWRSLFLDHNFLVGRIPPQFTTGAQGVRGSLAQNCLHCPRKFRGAVEGRNQLRSAPGTMGFSMAEKLSRLCLACQIFLMHFLFFSCF